MARTREATQLEEDVQMIRERLLWTMIAAVAALALLIIGVLVMLSVGVYVVQVVTSALCLALVVVLVLAAVYGIRLDSKRITLEHSLARINDRLNNLH